MEQETLEGIKIAELKKIVTNGMLMLNIHGTVSMVKLDDDGDIISKCIGFGIGTDLAFYEPDMVRDIELVKAVTQSQLTKLMGLSYEDAAEEFRKMKCKVSWESGFDILILSDELRLIYDGDKVRTYHDGEEESESSLEEFQKVVDAMNTMRLFIDDIHRNFTFKIGCTEFDTDDVDKIVAFAKKLQ